MSKRRKPRRASARSPGRRAGSRDPLARIRTLVRETIALADEVLDAVDPLDVEIWATDIVAGWYRAEDPSPETLARSVVPGGLVEAAELEASPRSAVLLHALAALAPSSDAHEAARATSRLGAAGLAAPDWADEIGRPQLAGSWLTTDLFGDADLLLISFRYRGRAEHALSVLIDRNLGEIVKDAALLQHASETLDRMRADPEMTVREIAPEEASQILGAALARADDIFDLEEGDELRALKPLLESRRRLLPSVDPAPEPEPPGFAERDWLVEDFLASAFAREVPEAESLAPLFLDFKCDHLDGDPLRWSPTVVEILLCGFLPRKTSPSDEQIQAMPAALGAWLRFVGLRRGLPEHLIDQMLASVGEFTPEFQRSVRDPTNFGPAKLLVEQMFDEGVDLSDDSAVQGWIARFNARSFQERDRILDPSPRPRPVDGVAARRRWTIPPMTGTFDGIDLGMLDPDDPDDRSILIRAEHPDHAAAIDRGDETLLVGGMDVNPRLHMATHEVVANQLWNADPLEVWETALRLRAMGYERHEVLHMLMSTVTDELWQMLQVGKPYDSERHIAALRALPRSWEELRDG